MGSVGLIYLEYTCQWFLDGTRKGRIEVGEMSSRSTKRHFWCFRVLQATNTECSEVFVSYKRSV